MTNLNLSDNSLQQNEAVGGSGFIEEMFKAGVHFGYSRSSRNPKMKNFIFWLRNNVELFNLEKTKEKLDEAKDFLRALGSEKKTILFVGTKAVAAEILKKYSGEIGMPYVTERWIGGTLTNFNEIKKRRDHMEDLTQKKESGELAKYTKKEQLQVKKKIARLSLFFSGLLNLRKLPSALIVVDTKEEKNAVAEAKKIGIPIVGIMNSDCNPEDAGYAIPANDNSKSSIEFLLKELTEAYKKGLSEAEKKAVEAEKVTEEEKKKEEAAKDGDK